MGPRFWDVYRDVRTVIQKPDDALYILHTSIGAITVHRFVYRAEAGVVFLQGTDEHGRERVAGFSKQQIATFAFEIRMKSADKNGQIRFNQNLAIASWARANAPAIRCMVTAVTALIGRRELSWPRLLRPAAIC